MKPGRARAALLVDALEIQLEHISALSILGRAYYQQTDDALAHNTFGALVDAIDMAPIHALREALK